MKAEKQNRIITALRLSALLEGKIMEWIDVNSRLPDKNKRVWIWPYETTAYYIEAFDFNGKHYPTGWYGDNAVEPVNDVTHWTELPQPPSNAKLTGRGHES